MKQSIFVILLSIMVVNSYDHYYNEEFEGFAVGQQVVDTYENRSILWLENNAVKVVANGFTGKGYGTTQNDTSGNATLFFNDSTLMGNISLMFRCSEGFLHLGTGHHHDSNHCEIVETHQVAPSIPLVDQKELFLPAETSLTSVLTYDGSAYFGTGTTPGRIVQFNLTSLEWVTTISLEVGSNNLVSAVEHNGYGYWGTDTSPGRIVKIDLSSMKVIGQIVLSNGFNKVTSGFQYNGYIYFTTNSIPSGLIKIDPTNLFLLNATSLSGIDNVITSVAHNGYGYFGMHSGDVIKINLSTLSMESVETNSGPLRSALILNSYVYFTSDQAKLFRVSTDQVLSFSPLDLHPSETRCIVSGSYNGDIYLATQSPPLKIVRVASSGFQRVNGVTLPSEIDPSGSSFIHNSYLYSGSISVNLFTSTILQIVLPSLAYSNMFYLADLIGITSVHQSGNLFYLASMRSVSIFDMESQRIIHYIPMYGVTFDQHFLILTLIAYDDIVVVWEDSSGYLIKMDLSGTIVADLLTLPNEPELSYKYGNYGYFLSRERLPMTISKVRLDNFTLEDDFEFTNYHPIWTGLQENEFIYLTASHITGYRIVKFQLDTMQIIHEVPVDSGLGMVRYDEYLYVGIYSGEILQLSADNLDFVDLLILPPIGGSYQLGSASQYNGLGFWINTGSNTLRVVQIDLIKMELVDTIYLNLGIPGIYENILPVPTYNGYMYFVPKLNDNNAFMFYVHVSLTCNSTGWTEASIPIPSDTDRNCFTLSFNGSDLTIDNLLVSLESPPSTTGPVYTSGTTGFISTTGDTDPISTTTEISTVSSTTAEMTTGTTGTGVTETTGTTGFDFTTTGTTGVVSTTGADNDGSTTGSLGTTGLPAETTTTGPIQDSIVQEDDDTGNNAAIIIISMSVLGGILFIGLIGCLLFVYFRRKKRDNNKNNNEEDELDVLNQSKESGSVPTYNPSSSSVIEGTINNVTIISKIGEGAFGSVYLGNWNSVQVALKKLNNFSESRQQEFIRESDLLRDLNHPNIVRFLGIYISGRENNDIYMVMEYCKRGSLLDLLQKSSATKLPIYNLIHIIISIAKGMKYLEQKKVIHLDLSARNILISMIEGEYEPKISDFGMSRASETYNMYTKAVPVRWTAVEILKQLPATSKSDVWSFGVVCYEIMNYGLLPYADIQSNSEVVTFVLGGGRLAQPALCPNEIYDIMKKCWIEEVDERIEFKEIVANLEVYYSKEAEETSLSKLPDSAHNYALSSTMEKQEGYQPIEKVFLD